MSSPPGRPPQQKSTTTNTAVANSVDNTASTSKARGLYRKPIYRTTATHPSSTRAALANRSPRNTIDGDSEAETDVLPEATTTPATKSDAPRRSSVAESGETAEYERGRGRRASEGGERKRPRGIDADVDADESDSRGRGVANERKTRGRPPKRRAQAADQEDDSSDLSSVPSPSSRTGSPPSYLVHPHHPHHHIRHHRRRPKQQIGRLRKRKLLGSGGVGSDVVAPAVADSSGFDAENSDDDTRHGRPRRRKRRRSLPPDSPPPPRLVIKSSPQASPHPLSPLKSNARITEKVHAGQRTLKQRKLPPPPLNTSREKDSSDEALSSSPSFRDRSPSSSSRHPRRHQSTIRTPGSPVSMSHKPRRDTAGRTHLHRACQRGAVSEVETILSLGKEFLNEEDNAGYMPLHEACLYGHLDVVKVLLNNGAWLDVPSRIELDTPLLDAVDNGHADVVKYLLELGADPRKRNKQGQTALDANDSNRDFPEKFREIEDLLKVAINKLRSKRSSDDENPRASAPADSHSSRDPSVASPIHQSPHPTPLPTATRRRNARTEQSRKDLLWLDAGKNGLQKLRELAREGDQQLVHALLERGTKPDAESLIGAIKGGHTDTVSLLLAYNNAIVDPDPGNYSRDGNRKNRDTSTPAGEETPMLAAIGRGNLEVLRYLLENGVNPRRLDYRGKSYAEIAREREGEFWPEEVDMLKKAWDKAGSGGAVKARNPSFSHKAGPSSPKSKKSITTEGKPAPSNPRRPSSNPSTSFLNQSTNPPRHSSPVNASKYDSTTALSDRESTTAEPLGPPRPQRNAKRTEAEVSTPVVKKKRRLVSGKDLAEESLAKSHTVSSTSGGGDVDAKLASGRPADRATRRPRPSIGDPKPEPRPSVSATPAGRGAPKSRPDRNDSSHPKTESNAKDRKAVPPKRERTRSPASRSEESRKSELEENKRGRRFLNRVEEPPLPSHNKKKLENDNSAMRPKEGGATKNTNVKRKMHPNEAAARKDTDNQARRLSRDEAPPDRTLQYQRDERARRNKTKDIADARRGKERPDRGGGGLERRVKSRDEIEKRRASAELETRERKRQNYLTKEMMSILNKAQEESQAARTNEIELRKQHTEAERVEREAKEREEEEARKKEEEERIAREAREKEAREAKEREIREREAREREAEEKRLAEVKRREEERERLEEERRREAARVLEEQRQEAERKRLELLEQQRLEEIERKRKAAEEEERKRQELEKAQREKEARDREIAEELQRLEAERKRLEEEAAEKRRKEEEEEEARKREIARKEALPYALRQAEEEPGVTSDRSKFLPLYSATFSVGSAQSSPTMTTPVKSNPGNGVVQVNGVRPVKSYKWILNVQAALVLGVTDLSFSTYGDIKSRSVTEQERFRMWSVLSVMLCESAYQSDRPVEELENARREERDKFLRMSPVFWIKFDDFIDIINADPRYSPLVASRPRTIDVDTTFFGVSTNNTPVKNGVNGSSVPATPISTSKEEMALRLSKLFGTPPPAQPPIASPQPSPSMPPPPAGSGTTPVLSAGEST